MTICGNSARARRPDLVFVVLAAVMLFPSASPAHGLFQRSEISRRLMNNNAVNVIWAVGLLVVLIAGGHRHLSFRPSRRRSRSI